MITRLDRYVCRVFVTSWLASLVFFVGFFGVVNFFGNLENLVEVDVGAASKVALIMRFYAYQAPSIYLEVVPFVMLMTALMTVTRLQKHNELMAMVLTGRSRRRVLRPVFGLTIAFGLLQVVVQEEVAPRFAEERDRLRSLLIEHDESWIIKEVNLLDSRRRQFRATSFNVDSGVIGSLLITWRDDRGRYHRVEGRDAIYSERDKGWRLSDGHMVITSADTGENIDGEASFVQSETTPGDLLVEDLDPFDMSYGDILDKSERYPLKPTYQLLRHYHFTYPISVVLLVYLGVPFVTRSREKRPMAGVGYAMALCFGFMILNAVSQDLGARGILPYPAVAAWLPVIVAGSLVVVLSDTAEN